jgi:hypothetical protein
MWTGWFGSIRTLLLDPLTTPINTPTRDSPTSGIQCIYYHLPSCCHLHIVRSTTFQQPTFTSFLCSGSSSPWPLDPNWSLGHTWGPNMYYDVTISSAKSLVEVMWRFARCIQTTTLLIHWRSLFHNQSMRRTWGPWVLDTYMSDLDVSESLLSWLCTVWITIIYIDYQVCDLFMKLVNYDVILYDP